MDVQVANNGMLAARANQGCVETGAGEAQAAPTREVQSRVVSELSREIRAVQQRKRRLEAVSASTRQGALMHAIASPLVGVVYNYSGRDPAITVDFVYGRGQSRRRHLEEASGMQAVAIFTDVEKVFSQGMPALCGRRAACAVLDMWWNTSSSDGSWSRTASTAWRLPVTRRCASCLPHCHLRCGVRSLRPSMPSHVLNASGWLVFELGGARGLVS